MNNFGMFPSPLEKSQKLKSSPRKEPTLIWDRKVPNTQLGEFKKKIAKKYNFPINSYWDLHKWSLEHFENFWEELWEHFGFISSKPHEKVFKRCGDGFLDVEWFPGLLFNQAENLVRIRDDRIAIIYADETGYEERITFAEMYEESKLYAAAFRKHGLKKGDRVACYISNRKEAVYTYIATLSIGAIFSGPHPFYGAQPAANIVQKLEPKFLISIDHHQDKGIQFHNIDNLPYIVERTPSLEKVIIIASKPETYTRDISNIRNSCFLHDFLESGKETDGTVPDIIFEQLPFSHPVSINFTSGTSGLPKGPVHSAGTLLSELVVIIFYWDLKPSEVLYSCYPPGWTLFNISVMCLSWGVTLFLYAGNPCYERLGANVWDIFAEYKVGFSLMVPSAVDKFEKLNWTPGPNSNLDHFKVITLGGSPVKAQNCFYIKNKVKEDVFVCSQYGATESFGSFSGLDMNMPSYAGENQLPGLAMNIHCFNSEGKSVINERGEMVLTQPVPNLPTHIWKDDDNAILKETYLSKYPGVWYQNDEIWINPKTRGIVVIGRSDDTLIQNGDRFGAVDVYFAIHDIEEIQDYICVGQYNSRGDTRAVLFIKMKDGFTFTPEFKKKLEEKIFKELWSECVPEVILEVKDIPYNLNNKKLESVVRKIVATNEIPQVSNIRNPECLKYYCNIPVLVSYDNSA